MEPVTLSVCLFFFKKKEKKIKFHCIVYSYPEGMKHLCFSVVSKE